MNEWDKSNKGLGATWMIEKAISHLGGNNTTIVEFGSGNGRLLNFVVDLGIEDVVGYDINPLKNGRLVPERIITGDVTQIKLVGDICLAFNFFDNKTSGIIDEVLDNFALIIGWTKDLSIFSNYHYSIFEGYKQGGYFIASKSEGLIKQLSGHTVFDYLVVGRFTGITPSVRKVLKSLRGTGHRVMTTLPRSNGAETLKWALRHNIKHGVVLMNNISDWERQLRTECRKEKIPVITFEDGFIPHYTSLHFDYRGFCWDSSFPDKNIKLYDDVQEDFSHVKYDMTPPIEINKPFVFVPLQTLGDSVILHGSDIKNWEEFVNKVRGEVSEKYDLVVKNHPREHTKYVSRREDIKVINSGLGWAIKECEFVVGVNSGVLYESSIIFNKPVYYYGRSWYDKHPEVCVPARGKLESYEVTRDMIEYRRRFWQMMKSHQLDYSKEFDDQRLLSLISQELKYAL
jgi:SAM-dependent methyltransferase